MQATHPLVSIIIPTYNRWPHVNEAVGSVLNQSYKNIECIIVDDASTDDSFTQLQNLYASHPKVKLVRLSENSGQAAARNTGARLALGKLVCFLDSDDFLMQDSIESRAELYQRDDTFHGIAFGGNITTTRNTGDLPGRKDKGEPLNLEEYLKNQGWLHTNTVMMPTSVFLEVGGFNEQLRSKEDIEFFIRALCVTEARFCGKTCARMRAVDTNRARNNYDHILDQEGEFIQALKNNRDLQEHASPNAIKGIIHRNILSHLNALYRKGQYTDFRDYMRQASRKEGLPLTARLLKRYFLSYIKRNSHPK